MVQMYEGTSPFYFEHVNDKNYHYPYRRLWGKIGQIPVEASRWNDVEIDTFLSEGTWSLAKEAFIEKFIRENL